MSDDVDGLIQPNIDFDEGQMKPLPLVERPPAAELYEFIEQLADIKLHVRQTDHLSDELHAFLTSEERLAIKIVDPALGGHLDLDALGRYGPEERALYLKYYADEEDRKAWSQQFGDEIPTHEDPPFDRDQNLPRAFLSLHQH